MIAHNEGEVALRTLNSLMNAAKILDKNGISYQWLINIDNGDKKTILSLKDAIKNINGKVYFTKFGDPGRARNYVLKKARGEYVAIIDADDIVSENWLMEGLNIAIAAEEPVLVHPGIEVRFDAEKILSVNVRTQYENRWHETLALIEGNRWCSVALGRREYFIKNPYSVSRNGFGYEDYFFNCSIVLNGIHHVISEETVVFCLQKVDSVSDKTHKNQSVLPYSELFNLRRLQKNMKAYQLPAIADNEREKKAQNKKRMDFVEAEIKKLVGMEKELLYLRKGLKSDLFSLNDRTGDLTIGVIFCRMIANINMRFMPRTLDFVDDLTDCDEKESSVTSWKVVTDSSGFVRLNDKMKILDFGFGFGEAPESVKNIVIERIIVQTGARSIKCNGLARKWMKEHSVFVSKNGIRSIRK